MNRENKCKNLSKTVDAKCRFCNIGIRWCDNYSVSILKSMKKSFGMRGVLVLAALWIGSTLSLRAATIFNNSVNDTTNRFNPGTYEVGDQIVLAPGSIGQFITGFSFEYWGTNTASPTTFAGDVQARVRFYLNDGTPFNGYASPGTQFYDSGFFSVSPTARSVLTFAQGADNIPIGGFQVLASEMTWSVQFRGMGATDSLGVDIYNPPTVGMDYPDYWQNNSLRDWTLMTNSITPIMNFAAVVSAVPEPSVLALSLAGGLGILVMVRRLRRTS
ncbi:MAG: PEP-CTERM sorting domain-containing protein [Verrucomicrobiota bacterium]